MDSRSVAVSAGRARGCCCCGLSVVACLVAAEIRTLNPTTRAAELSAWLALIAASQVSWARHPAGRFGVILTAAPQ